ncbi:DUF6677 family protein [Paenibacillus sp. 481]|uniref:DUF6677 family protein n=1 Tax=Paenibacillus sp. 481 TaxID=2835869 RepID=UPI001E5B63FD|nr:DUF6677 family protein [Paenibacillus sp. 481]UHA74737.1 hypothetical protein KIK04_06640 [Paenibacillus sp. 481]
MSNQKGKTSEESFIRERMERIERMQPISQMQSFNSSTPPRKSKFVAVLLSLFFPGLGHFYLRLMQRGLLIMMFLMLDIVAIVYFTTKDVATNVPLIVLLSLMLPVIYFFNLFDAMQNTEKVNEQAMYGIASEPTKQGPWFGVLFVSCGVLMLLLTVDPSWLGWFFTYGGSYAGATVLIGGGIYLLYKETNNKS